MIRNIESFYNQEFQVLRYTMTGSGYGGIQGAWNTHLTVRGRLRPLTADERLRADKVSLYSTHRLYASVTDITSKDRVVDVYGNNYAVKGLKNPMNMDNHLEIDLELIE